MAEVTSGQEGASGGSADRGPGVVAGEADPFGGEAVEVGGFDLGLTVAPEFAVAEVVGENEDDVGFGG